MKTFLVELLQVLLHLLSFMKGKNVLSTLHLKESSSNSFYMRLHIPKGTFLCDLLVVKMSVCIGSNNLSKLATN